MYRRKRPLARAYRLATSRGGQHRIARGIRTTLDGDQAIVLASDFGHDGFLIETAAVIHVAGPHSVKLAWNR